MTAELGTELRLAEDTAARFLAEHFPTTRLRAMIASDAEYDDGLRELRRQAGELGWYAPFVPGEFGGGSLGDHGIVDATIIARQRGHGLAPGPFTDIQVAANAISAVGSKDQRESLLPQLATGDQVIACAFDWPATGRQHPAVRVEETPDGVILDGCVRPVAYAASADALLVWADQPGQTRRFLVRAGAAGLHIHPLEGLDLTARAAEVAFSHVFIPRADELPEGSRPEDGAESDVAIGALLVAADSCGAMERLLEMTVDYVKSRQAFGRPIGSFQAVKHQLADISMLVQASRAATAAATEALASQHHDAVEIVSIAKAFVSDHSQQVAQGCLQLHGGIGYAWEHDLHLYLRRLAANGVTYGSARYHREAIAQRHLGPAPGAQPPEVSR
jgi:alkylation response protein AidB-like acyl-CoA dehydrogenase